MPIDDRVPRIPNDEDLDDVMCDNWSCDYVSDYGKCYNENYLKCDLYLKWKKLYKRDDGKQNDITERL